MPVNQQVIEMSWIRLSLLATSQPGIIVKVVWTHALSYLRKRMVPSQTSMSEPRKPA